MLVQRGEEGVKRRVKWENGCLWGECYMLRKSHGKVYLYKREVTKVITNTVKTTVTTKETQP